MSSRRDTRTAGEPIRSMTQVVYDVSAAEQMVLTPKQDGVSYAFFQGATAIAVVNKQVRITYNPGVDTVQVLRLAVVALAASNALMSVGGDDAGVLQAAFGTPAGNLWDMLLAAGGAQFRLDSSGIWIPWNGDVSLSASVTSALLPDNAYNATTFDLTGLRANVATGLAGRNFAVLGLTGTASVRFSVIGNDPVDLFPLDKLDGFEFTDILLSNAAQPGKSLTIWVGRRV